MEGSWIRIKNWMLLISLTGSFISFLIHNRYMKKILKPTPYQDLNSLLDIFVNNLKETLQDNLVGIYLQGSFAVGDFDENSDCDFIVITHKEISKEKIKDLEKIHKIIRQSDSSWREQLEGSYFSKNIIASTKYIRKKVWYFDRGSINIEKSNHCNKVHVRWVLRNKGVVLYGPNPKDFIEEINIQEFKKECYDTIQQFGENILSNSKDWDNQFYQAFIVLSYCRMIHDLKNGSNNSKLAGANWVKENLDPQWEDLIDKTWINRIDPARAVK